MWWRAQRRVDAVGQVGVAQLVRRQVDRDAHQQALVAPDAGLAAGLVDHPVAHRADQAEALGDRDEDWSGADHAALSGGASACSASAPVISPLGAWIFGW